MPFTPQPLSLIQPVHVMLSPPAIRLRVARITIATIIIHAFFISFSPFLNSRFDDVYEPVARSDLYGVRATARRHQRPNACPPIRDGAKTRIEDADGTLPLFSPSGYYRSRPLTGALDY